MEPEALARALLDAAWISARLATVFSAIVAVGAMAVVATRAHSAARLAAPRVRRPGAGPRLAAQFAALGLGVLVTAWTEGQAQAWLPPPVQAVTATLAALAVLFAGTFVAWAAWSLGSSFTLEAVVPEEAKLVTSGPFALVRHPFYAAWGLLGTGAALSFGSLAGAVVFLAAWVPATRWRAELEEEALAAAWPGEWPRYAAKTPRFLPRW
jgi:protein-S-isoprenylcysteine O-methyltransferase Ste14